MANFPISVSTTDQLHTGVNNLATSLSSAINSVVTTIPVASTTGFPSVGAITIDSERISYTSINPTQFLGCTRGFGGTIAVSHLNAKPVEFTYGAEFHNDLRDEIIAIEQDLSDRLGLNTGSDEVNLSGPLYTNGQTMADSITQSTDLRLTSFGAFLESDAGFISVNTLSNGKNIHLGTTGSGASAGNIYLQDRSHLTTDTGGFVLMPVINGTPTGTPTFPSQDWPFVFDKSANKLWVYNDDTNTWVGVVLA